MDRNDMGLIESWSGACPRNQGGLNVLTIRAPGDLDL